MGGPLHNLLLFTRHRPQGFVWNGVDLSQFIVQEGSPSVAIYSGHNAITFSGGSPASISANGNLITAGTVLTFYFASSTYPPAPALWLLCGTDSTGAGPNFVTIYANPYIFSGVGWDTAGDWTHPSGGATNKYGSILSNFWDGAWHKFVITINGTGTGADLSIDSSDWGSANFAGSLEGNYFGLVDSGNPSQKYIYGLTIVN